MMTNTAYELVFFQDEYAEVPTYCIMIDKTDHYESFSCSRLVFKSSDFHNFDKASLDPIRIEIEKSCCENGLWSSLDKDDPSKWEVIEINKLNEEEFYDEDELLS